MSEPQHPAEAQLIKRAGPDPTNIHGEGGQLFTILKKAAKVSADEAMREAGDTNGGIAVGKKSHLIQKLVARDLRDFNATHAICIDAKKSSTVGLGHRKREIHDSLDGLCRFSWQDTLDALAEDYFETGECFLEVVFGNGGEDRLVTGLHHIESAGIHVELEQEGSSELYHYVIEGETGSEATIVLAKWDDLSSLKERFSQGVNGDDDPFGLAANDAQDANSSALAGTIRDSEVIHIRQATNRSRYYGYPDYMSAVPSIELVQCMAQHEFDFYFNRGVPEFLLFLIGKNVGKCWPKIGNLIKSNQGLGNSHKTGGVHIPGNPDEVVVQVEKLAMEDAGNSGFAEKSGTLDMRVATAHGMPPQLANIALPGKIGGANEGPNAMLTFQMRKLGQAQKNFSGVFACTLGGDGVTFAQPDGSAAKKVAKDLWTAKGTKSEDENGMPVFVQEGNGFATILDGMTLGAKETLNTMKEPLAGSGRDVSAGKLEGARDRGDQDPKKRPASQ